MIKPMNKIRFYSGMNQNQFMDEFREEMETLQDLGIDFVIFKIQGMQLPMMNYYDMDVFGKTNIKNEIAIMKQRDYKDER